VAKRGSDEKALSNHVIRKRIAEQVFHDLMHRRIGDERIFWCTRGWEKRL
jgi:hypothetical protein